MHKICIFTGTRAEYGLLKPLIKSLKEHRDVTIQLLVSGTHLSESSGSTWHEIEKDGYKIDERVEIILDASTDTAVCTAMGLGLMRFGEALKRLAPECLIVLGDRFEAFAVSAAATVCRIPIAHLYGGEQTLGAVDEAFRHAITKMSHLHFTSTQAYRQRVIQMGENPQSVRNVGALGVENALSLPLLNPIDVSARLGIKPSQKYFLATFHPATMASTAPEVQLTALLDAFGEFPEHVVIVTGSNADAGGHHLNRLLEQYAAQHPQKVRFFASLGVQLYLSAARDADAVVGNSSSAVIEVPSLHVPSVDIGARQAGRIRSATVIVCDADLASITTALRKATSSSFKALCRVATNPYEQAQTSAAIADCLISWSPTDATRKKFYDLLPQCSDDEACRSNLP